MRAVQRHFLSMVALCVAAPVLAEAEAVPTVPDPADVAWVRTHEASIGKPDSDVSSAEALVIAHIIAGAKIVGLGEPFHGHEEPLAYRNRLIRYLVQHQGLTAVALESGIAETKGVGDYVLGGPGDAVEIVQSGLSWRFGDMAANVELVTWLREWNREHRERRIHLYGIDVSGGDSRAEFGRSRRSVNFVVSYLGRIAPEPSRAVRDRLTAFADRFSNASYAGMDLESRATLHEALMQTGAFLAAQRGNLIAASSSEDYDWAQRITADMLEAERIFAVWPRDAAKPLPGAMLVANIRDKAMAANTLWALSREGKRGRILLFESNSHVSASALRPVGRDGESGTNAGQELRKMLGGRYRVIATASSLGKPADDPGIGSVDRLLLAAARPRAILDIRHAPLWWDRPQSLAHGGARINQLTPKQAFDGIIFVETLGAAHLLGSETAK